jgi:hypothetical protein
MAARKPRTASASATLTVNRSMLHEQMDYIYGDSRFTHHE